MTSTAMTAETICCVKSQTARLRTADSENIGSSTSAISAAAPGLRETSERWIDSRNAVKCAEARSISPLRRRMSMVRAYAG